MSGKVYRCHCGSRAPLVYMNIEIYYQGTFIRIGDVPTFVCDNHHSKMSDEVQDLVYQRLEEAHQKQITQISYDRTP